MKNAHTDDDLDVFEGNLPPEVDPEASAAAFETESIPWNGRSSRVALAYPINRDFVIVGPHSECIDCLAKGKSDRSHAFHIRASKGEDGTWRGPEATHRLDLEAGGWLANTKEARARAERQAEVDALRGTHGTAERPEGFPELRAPTTEQMRRAWHPVLKDGPGGAAVIERGQRTEGVAELREAVREGLGGAVEPLVELVREIMAGREEKQP
jgi:hypothetical protein